MAKPIKETPILFGHAARSFDKKIAENEKNVAPRAEYERVMSNYRKMKDKIKKP